MPPRQWLFSMSSWGRCNYAARRLSLSFLFIAKSTSVNVLIPPNGNAIPAFPAFKLPHAPGLCILFPSSILFFAFLCFTFLRLLLKLRYRESTLRWSPFPLAGGILGLAEKTDKKSACRCSYQLASREEDVARRSYLVPIPTEVEYSTVPYLPYLSPSGRRLLTSKPLFATH